MEMALNLRPQITGGACLLWYPFGLSRLGRDLSASHLLHALLNAVRFDRTRHELRCVCVYTGVERQHVGVVTFDSAIHFFRFNADMTGYQMLLVADGECPFAPAASSSLVVPLQAAADTVS